MKKGPKPRFTKDELREHHNAANRSYMARYRKRGRARVVQIKCVFGLNAADYEALLEKQNYKCAICREPETAMLRGKVKELALDHDHRTNRVRGALCSRLLSPYGKCDF